MILADRGYQRGALNGGPGGVGIYAALREHRSCLLILPTGGGKTIMFARVAEACAARKGGRVLILAHRQELIEQARSKLIAATSLDSWQIGIEMGKLHAHAAHMVVCASVQTMRGARLKSYPSDYFKLVIVDEAHHAVASTYKEILKHFSGAKVLGVTATPKPLAGSKLFEVIAYQYGLAEAIRDGYLVPIQGTMVLAPEIDLSEVKTVAGDFAHEQLARVMEGDVPVAVTAKASLDLAGARPTIVFCVSVEQARLVAGALNAMRPGCAAALDGSASEDHRKATLKRYDRGEIQFLVNCALFTEGFDAPRTACIVVARPTKSDTLYRQMIGRGTRLLGATMEASIAAGKSDILVVDLVGATGRHELMQSADLLTEDPEIRARAKKKMAAGGQVDIDLLLAGIKDDMDEERRELERKAIEEAKYKAQQVDLMRQRGKAGPAMGPLPESTMTAEQAPTFWHLDTLARGKYKGAEEQLKLHRLGVHRGPWTRESGRALVSEIGKRRRRGLCSPKMADLLRRAKLNPDVSFDVAAAAIEAIRGNNWRTPPDLLVRLPELQPAAAEVA